MDGLCGTVAVLVIGDADGVGRLWELLVGAVPLLLTAPLAGVLAGGVSTMAGFVWTFPVGGFVGATAVVLGGGTAILGTETGADGPPCSLGELPCKFGELPCTVVGVELTGWLPGIAGCRVGLIVVRPVDGPLG